MIAEASHLVREIEEYWAISYLWKLLLYAAVGVPQVVGVEGLGCHLSGVEEEVRQNKWTWQSTLTPGGMGCEGMGFEGKGSKGLMV